MLSSLRASPNLLTQQVLSALTSSRPLCPFSFGISCALSAHLTTVDLRPEKGTDRVGPLWATGSFVLSVDSQLSPGAFTCMQGMQLPILGGTELQ